MKNLHLILSSLIIIPIALAYGMSPGITLPLLFDITPGPDTCNIFRAVMGLYLGITLVMITGVFKPGYWETATIVNMVFMGGLALGRVISFALDGMPSPVLVAGFAIECVLAAMACFNWTKYKTR